MKDWIKSPEPEDPDEVLARHRKYEQEDEERRNEASTSQLPSAAKPTTAARTVVVGKRRRRNTSTSRSPEGRGSPSTFAPTNRNVRTRLASSSSTAAAAAAAATSVKAEPDDGGFTAGLYGTTPPPDGDDTTSMPPRYQPDEGGGGEDEDPTRPVPLKRKRIKHARLMSLADMSFRTVLTHLPSLDSSEISSIIQPELPRLSHRYSAPLAQACDAHLDHLARLSRAKEAALRAREEARTARRTSVAIDTSGGARGLRGSRAGGGGGLVAASGKPKVEKSQGGKKIWMRAKMAAGVRR